MQGCGCRPAKPLAVLQGMSKSSPYTFTEDFTLELGEDGQ
jgi:hypothetical protein